MVGCGNMGFAMLKTWMQQDQLGYDFTVLEPNTERHSEIKALGAKIAKNADNLNEASSFDLVFLAVKPHIMAAALEGVKGKINGKTYVSVAAGLPIQFFEKYLDSTASIIRTMPNTPAAVGAGAIAMMGNENVTPLAIKQAETLLQLNGIVCHVDDEEQIDAITALSGSGPAYIFHMAECLEKAGVDMGLPPQIARDFARQTIFGAGKLMHQSDETAATLRQSVTSPNGTTQAALEVLMHDSALQKLISGTTKAAKDRSIELSKPTLS